MEPEGENSYRQRTTELKSSQYFWDDRLVRPNIFRIVILGVAAVIVSLTIWYLSTLFIENEVISAMISLIIFTGLLILCQPQIYNRILSKVSNLPDSTILDVDFMKNMRCFFYRDVDTGELHEDVLFVRHDGQIAAWGMYKIDTIPIGISGEFRHFIRMIYGQKIPIFWNYLQAPVTEKKVKDLTKNVTLDRRMYLSRLRNDDVNSYLLNKEGIWEARTVFGTSSAKRIGINITNTIKNVYEETSLNLQKLESAFLVNFPHSKLAQLKGKDILSAIYAQLTNGGRFRFF